MRCYSELIQLSTFKERFEYLKLDGTVADATFGFDRYLNQNFYTSQQWRKIRDEVIIRDEGCDLGLIDYPILGKRLLIHHMNPISQTDILRHSDLLLNPEYLICTTYDTHNAIHYGDPTQIPYKELNIRTPNDTCPWRR